MALGPTRTGERRGAKRLRTAKEEAIPVGARFANWGLGQFIFRVFLTFGIITHYCVGARWPTGQLFMQNISLWWACPWTFSVAAVQAGGLGMVATGLVLLVAPHAAGTDGSQTSGDSVALLLCNAGLFGVFAVGYPGYFVFDAVWPSFFYSPIADGKNLWLLGQALFIALYFAGLLMAFVTVRKVLDQKQHS
jgi:hypothetical protein